MTHPDQGSGRGSAASVAYAGLLDGGVSRLSKTRIAIVVTAACLVYVLIHFVTIVRSRQVWFDETFFASIAHSLSRTGEFDLAVSPLWLTSPVYLYGPVYFLIVGAIFELFGPGIVQNRLPGMLFAFALLPVVYLILRQERVRHSIAGFACILLALDPTFHQAMHSGRTDTTAIFFMLVGLFALLRSRDTDGRSSVWWSVGSGISSALAVLTTPRPGYMLIAMGLILLARWYRQRSRDAAVQLFAWGATFACVYAIWVAYAFGNIGAMLGYYSGFAEEYTGGAGIRLVHLPLLSTVGALLVLVVARAPRRALDELTVFSLLAVAGFYMFVKSTTTFGALYAFLMIPPAYLALANLVSAWVEVGTDERRTRLVWYGGFGLLLLLNVSAFLARSALEVAEWERRDPAVAEDVIRHVVPRNSRVVGDEQFYFAVLGSGSDFQYIERGGTLSERVSYHRDVYQFDYLITNRGGDSEIVQAYMRAVPLEKVAEIPASPTTRLAKVVVSIGRWFGLSNSLMSGYDGTIFARAR